MIDFKVPENKLIPQMEDETIEFWKKEKIFEKSVDQNPEKDLYVFYDGPPFISGLPHYGHLLSSIAKDLIPRFWTMHGKRVERVWGWDAHGITVENRVQEKLGIPSRRDIENFGLEKFTEACYDYTEKTSAEWDYYVNKIGRWVDFENAYRTTDQSYMESVMWSFKQLYDKGLIYQGTRTSLFCPNCGTPVSDFEIAMDNSYKDKEDPSITIKFPVTTEGKFQDVNILAWTTTPWTLPSNRALVVAEEETYVLVESGDEKYILAKPRLEFVFKDKEFNIIEEFKGKELLGLEYEPPFRIYKYTDKEAKVYSYEGMVTMDGGTGVVHSAPGFGEIDTEMGTHYGLTLMMTLDDEGKFISGTQDENPYEGMFYAKANPVILEDLTNRNILFANEVAKHRYPYHDRCGKWLIQKAQSSWFIDLESQKEELVKQNENINWIPEHVKEGVFKKTMMQAPDWCISRNRFWATPMPIWESEDGDRIVVSSVKEIEELSGQEVKDLHRPYIDEITIEKDGKVYKRRPEVLDSWMEAGSMPWSQIHYPYENQEKFEKHFPGDYIVEYKGQVRAWFQRMHILAVLLFGSNSFKNVICTGTMAGSDGRKMSKTYKNYTDPKEVLETYGGDALRLYLMNSPLMSGDDSNFNEEELKTKLRNVVNPLWNSAKFFLIYANQHDFDSEKLVDSENVLDKWILARLESVIKEFSEKISAYDIPPALKEMEDFVDDLSRWYVRRSRSRISSGDAEALSTLYNVLVRFSKATAPAIPFITEKIFKALSNECESVHLCKYPEINEALITENAEIIENMKKTRKIVAGVLSIRTQEKIAVRQPLQKVTVSEDQKVAEEYQKIILDEVNIKEIEFVSGEEILDLDLNISDELKIEGLARNMMRKIQQIRKKEKLSVADKIIVTYESNKETDLAVERFGEEIKKKVLAEEINPGTEYNISKL